MTNGHYDINDVQEAGVERLLEYLKYDDAMTELAAYYTHVPIEQIKAKFPASKYQHMWGVSGTFNETDAPTPTAPHPIAPIAPIAPTAPPSILLTTITKYKNTLTDELDATRTHKATQRIYQKRSTLRHEIAWCTLLLDVLHKTAPTPETESFIQKIYNKVLKRKQPTPNGELFYDLA